jgi:acetylglutamate synthase
VKAFVLNDVTNDEASMKKSTRMASMKKWFSDQLPVQRIKVSAVIPVIPDYSHAM